LPDLLNSSWENEGGVRQRRHAVCGLDQGIASSAH